MGLKRPPGPSTPWFGLPVIQQIKRDVLGFYESARLAYGDVIYMKLGPYHDYTFFHPEQIQDILVTQARHFVRMKRPIEVLRQWNGDGLLITEGETWRRHRRLVQPAFQPSRMGRYHPSIVAANRELLDGWSPLPNGTAIDFEAAMTSLTMEITGRALFGTSLGSEAAEMSRAVRILSKIAVDEMFAPFTWPDWLPLPGKADKRWAMRALDQLVRRFVRERRETGRDAGDLLSMLLLAVDEEGDGKGLTDQQARDQCVTFFLAGHDTTASALTWIGWCLATNREAAERAEAEVDKVLDGNLPTYDDVARLEYVGRFIKETLRCFPPAVGLVARQATRDVEIGEWTVPEGSLLRIMTYTVHHDERWFPEPWRFDPDRFAPQRVGAIPPGAYLPFGAGPRACIGAGLAMLEMTLFTAQLLQRYRLSPASDQSSPQLDPRMSLRPVGGMRVLLERRRSVSGGG